MMKRVFLNGRVAWSSKSRLSARGKETELVMGCCGGCKAGVGSSGVVWAVAGLALVGLVGVGVLGLGPARGDDKTDTKETPKPAETKPADVKPADVKPADAKPADATPGTKTAPKATEETDRDVLGFTVKDIDGKDQDLGQYKGKVVLIVNVASRCGFTPQYKSLQELYDSRKEKGLVILGFPANNFMGQEPGSDSEIREFCSKTYNVTFPMFAKISVKGDDVHPLFAKLTKLGGEPKWNFNKYLVDKQGNLVMRYDSRVKPDDAELVNKIDELIK
jgi:glutathione peroxidase